MGREKIIFDLVPSRVAVGLSSIIGITALAGQQALSLEYFDGGTLLIVNPGASMGWANGFIVPDSAILSFDAAGTIWLAATGATVTVNVLRGRSQGFEGASLGFTG